MNKSSSLKNKAERYRTPMRVTHVLRFPSGLTFPVCPSCEITLDREYQHYCDRCGQCLSWRFFSKAIVVLWSANHGGSPSRGK